MPLTVFLDPVYSSKFFLFFATKKENILFEDPFQRNLDPEMTLSVDGETKIYGIVGNPVSHSLSPLLHNAAFSHLGINSVYIPFHVEKNQVDLLKKMGDLGISGASVTIPHKGRAAKAAEDVDDLTMRCEAANTLLFQDGKVIARNTDGPGALRALKTVVPALRGKRFLILGYGGSATAIAHALMILENPAVVIVSGRNPTKRNRFVESLRKNYESRNTLLRSSDLTDLESEDVDIIIHTTPLGMKGASQELPLPESFIQSYHVVFDIVYTPARTPLLAHAEKKGAKTVQGYLMLLYQAVLQFELFTGQKAPENLMERELLAALRNRKK